MRQRFGNPDLSPAGQKRPPEEGVGTGSQTQGYLWLPGGETMDGCSQEKAQTCSYRKVWMF